MEYQWNLFFIYGFQWISNGNPFYSICWAFSTIFIQISEFGIDSQKQKLKLTLTTKAKVGF